MPKARPKTGEARVTRQPLSIDRLPLHVQEAIQQLYGALGKSWSYIEELSALPYNARWNKNTDKERNFGRYGFVPWSGLDEDVQKLFPEKRLPHTTLHRWYDIRIRQVKEGVMARAEQARAIAEKFVGADLINDREATMNAARDVIFSLLQNEGALARGDAAESLLMLIDMQQKAEANDLKRRKLDQDQQALNLRIREAELKLNRAQKEMDDAAKKVSNGGQMTLADLNRIRARTFGLDPIEAT